MGLLKKRKKLFLHLLQFFINRVLLLHLNMLDLHLDILDLAINYLNNLFLHLYCLLPKINHPLILLPLHGLQLALKCLYSLANLIYSFEFLLDFIE